MKQPIKSLATGIASALLTYAASIFATGLTAALTKPRNFSSGFWELLVVFGLGALLVAFAIHYLSIRRMAAQPLLAFVGFALTGIVAILASGLLAFYYKVLIAWLAGAFLASVLYRWLRPNNSFNPMPLRGTG